MRNLKNMSKINDMQILPLLHGLSTLSRGFRVPVFIIDNIKVIRRILNKMEQYIGGKSIIEVIPLDIRFYVEIGIEHQCYSCAEDI